MLREIKNNDTVVVARTDFDVAEKRKDFNSSKAVIASHTLRLFSIAGEVRAHDPLLTDTFLRDCRVDESDFPLFERFEALLGEHKRTLIDNDVTLDVILAMLRADEERRNRILEAIKAGVIVTGDKLDVVLDTRRDSMNYSVGSFLRDGIAALEDAARRITVSRANDLRRKASSLHRLMSNPANADKEKVSLLARDILPDFESLFGNDFPPIQKWFAISGTDRAALYLAQAHHVLRQLSNGLFNDFEIYTTYKTWSGLEPIAFIAGLPPSENVLKKRDPRHVKRLKAVVLCAGSGGMGLGLEAARFSLEALNDSNNDYAKTIKQNRPDLKDKVLVDDLRTLATRNDVEALTSGMKIDLIAGALPTKPFSLNQAGANDERQLLTHANDLVSRIRPRAFFFEVHKSFDANAHLMVRQQLLKELDILGYGTTFVTLNAREHGVPQDRTHHFLVGIEKKNFSRYSPPKSDKTITVNLRGALAELAFPDRSTYSISKQSGLDAGDDVRSKDQKHLDDWIENWLEEHGDDVGPDVRDLGKTKISPAWMAAPISYSFEARGHVGCKTSTGRLALTIPILKRLQGLPDDWELAGFSVSEQLKQIKATTPPRLALALARSIHYALTGEEVDPTHPDAQVIVSGKGRKKPRFTTRPEDSSDPEAFKATAWSREIEQEMQSRGLRWLNGEWVDCDDLMVREAIEA